MKASPPSFELPKEHGFWVMLPAALLISMKAGHWTGASVSTALVSGALAVSVGGLCHRWVRKSPLAQVGLSALLGLWVLPGALVGGASLQQAMYDVLAWSSLFGGSSLAVRASFAGVRRGGKRKARLLSFLATAFPLGAAAVLVGAEAWLPLRVAAIGGAMGLGFALWRPRPQRLKAVGVALSAAIALALLSQFV